MCKKHTYKNIRGSIIEIVAKACLILLCSLPRNKKLTRGWLEKTSFLYTRVGVPHSNTVWGWDLTC